MSTTTKIIATAGVVATLAVGIGACGSGSGSGSGSGGTYTGTSPPSANTVAQSIVGATADDGTTVESANSHGAGEPGWANAPYYSIPTVTVYPSDDATVRSCLGFSDGQSEYTIVTLHASGDSSFVPDPSAGGQMGC